MPLRPTAAAESDTTGSTETISLYASAAVIASAFYGTDANQKPKPATVAADRKSLDLTVLSGLNFLTVTLFSPASKSETAVLYQGDPVENPLAEIDVEDHSGYGSVQIFGS